jgi:hypothetical protein
MVTHGGKRQGAGRKPVVMEKSIKELVSPYMKDAVETVIEILTNKGAKEADRLTAAKLLLAYGYGNPKSEVDLNNNIQGSIPIDKWIQS